MNIKVIPAIGLFVIFSLVFIINPVQALEDTFVPYDSYIYNFWGNPVASPKPYIPDRIITSEELGLNLSSPQDLFVGNNDMVYVLDTGNNRIVILDNELRLDHIIDKFINKGKNDTFINPQGLFVNKNGTLYVADTGNKRIIVLDDKGELIREISAPVSDIEGLIPENYNYSPAKIAVDRSGRFYVVSRETYEGLVEFNTDGEFSGFIGAPRVKPNMIDYFWKRFIASETQRGKMALSLPTEFSNLDIDERGFIYITSPGGDISRTESIRRLNPAGKDVLRRTGFRPPIGDFGSALRDTQGELILPPSRFMDIEIGSFGIYNVLDVERGRIFTYDMYGQLLYVFGNRALKKGGFKNPVALSILSDNRILALDADMNRITVFKPTEYQQAIYGAIKNYHTGNYDLSTQQWSKVLTLNSNHDLAYTGIGEAYLRQNKYEEAIHSYKLGQNRAGYSEAFQLYRTELISRNFGLIMSIIFIIILLSFILIKLRNRIASSIKETAASSEVLKIKPFKKSISIFKSLRFGLHVIFHPFDGFWDLKHEKRGSLSAAISIMVMVCVSYIMMSQYTGFVFNTRDITKYNILLEIAGIIFPFLLWCSINWALTTLMEGKGTFRDIIIASAYALIPLVLINIPMTLISNYLTIEEGAFYYAFLIIAILWSGGLMFFGTMVTHSYDFSKTFMTVLFILAGIVFALFIVLLFFNLTSQFINFIKNIYIEILYRL